MKKYRLKSWVKDLLITILFIAIVIGGMLLYTDRIEKINNGQMVLISNSECDR